MHMLYDSKDHDGSSALAEATCGQNIGSRARGDVEVPPFHIVTPVWGRVYTQAFLELSLPSLLAPGNLPALPTPTHNLYQIITTTADRATIEASRAFKRLAELIPVQFNIIPKPDGATDRHALQSHCNRLGIMTADACDAAIVFYNPDILIADGSMRSLVRLLARGKRAIDVVGVRIVKEWAAPTLLRDYTAARSPELKITPRQLVSLAMEALHPLTMMHVYEAHAYDWMPSAIFWPVGNSGLVARCFHLHPICVYPKVKNAPFSTTVDDDYLNAACPDRDDEYVVLDSDEFCIFEMSGLDRVGPSVPRPTTDRAYAEWARRYYKPHHVELFCHRIILRGENWDDRTARAVMAQSDAVATRILKDLVDIRSTEEFENVMLRADAGRKRKPAWRPTG